MSSRGWSLILVLGLAACDVARPTDALRAPVLTANSGPALIRCPLNTPSSASATLGPLGGTLTLGGHRVVVPAGALLGPTHIQVTEPASQYVELSVQANGLPHFEFELPVVVTLSYERCTRSDLDKVPLGAWYIDELTKALLEDMGGVDDKAARTVTFSTLHFSGYAIAE